MRPAFRYVLGHRYCHVKPLVKHTHSSGGGIYLYFHYPDLRCVCIVFSPWSNTGNNSIQGSVCNSRILVYLCVITVFLYYLPRISIAVPRSGWHTDYVRSGGGNSQCIDSGAWGINVTYPMDRCGSDNHRWAHWGIVRLQQNEVNSRPKNRFSLVGKRDES